MVGCLLRGPGRVSSRGNSADARHSRPPGNPWNQLALVAATTGDTLTCIYSYLRALTVAQPFAQAEGNLGKTYARVLAEWRARGAAERDRARGGVAEIEEGREVIVLKEDMLVLQGSLYLGQEWVRCNEGEAPRAEFTVPCHRIDNLSGLVAFHRENLRYTILSRLVPTETLIKALVCSIAGHWQSRLGKAAAAYGSAAAHQKVWLEYILLMAGILLECASEEVAEVIAAEAASGAAHESALADGDDDDEDDRLHTKISAVVRRLLPSLRIFSKWLKSNQDVLTAPLDAGNPSLLSANSTTQQTVDRFWDAYLEFLARLETLFPLEKLPMLSEPLEEDFDMRGFAPLKRGMMEKRAGGAAVSSEGSGFEDGQGAVDGRNGVHPNDEQLMRISDLLVDGKMLVQTDVIGLWPYLAPLLTDACCSARAVSGTGQTPSQPRFSTAASTPAPRSSRAGPFSSHPRRSRSTTHWFRVTRIAVPTTALIQFRPRPKTTPSTWPCERLWQTGAAWLVMKTSLLWMTWTTTKQKRRLYGARSGSDYLPVGLKAC